MNETIFLFINTNNVNNIYGNNSIEIVQSLLKLIYKQLTLSMNRILIHIYIFFKLNKIPKSYLNMHFII